MLWIGVKRFCLLSCACSLLGCASFAGANNSRSHILFEHRTPIEKTAIREAAKAGLLGKLVDDKALIDNAGEITLGTAEIIKAITKVGGFPYSIIPQILSSGMKGASALKEEDSHQEVSKLYYVNGMRELKAKLPDGMVIESSFDSVNEETRSISR